MNHPRESGAAHPPFFIVGCPRSGTTLLQRMLNARSDVAVAPETFFVRRFWMQRDRYGDLSIDANLNRLVDDLVAMPAFAEMGLDPDDIREAAHQTQRKYGSVFGMLLEQFAAARGAEWVGEKTPDHVLHIPTLRRWFSEAKFVHLVRDPRAVVNSWRAVPWSSGYRWRDAEVWVEHVRAGREAEMRFPAQVMSLHFEALVRSPAAELEEVCDFLDVRYDDQMLAFHERETETVDVKREPWKERTTEPIDPEVADRWRGELSRSAQAQVEAVVASEMRHWDYECEVDSLRRQAARLRAWIERPAWKLGLILDDLQSDEKASDLHRSGRSNQLTVGFLHVGDPEHGVTRYGRVLAEAAREHLDVHVRETAVEWATDPARHSHQVREAARALSAADVVHVQYNERVWGGAFRALVNVHRFTSACEAELVATIHDVRDGYGPAAIVRRLQKRSTVFSEGFPTRNNDRRQSDKTGARDVSPSSVGSSLARSAVKGLRYVVQEIANTIATLRLAYRSARILVCTNEEARRLRSLVRPDRLTVIPHFVEERSRSADRKSAKEALNLGDVRVLGVLGFIHRWKGYDLVVEALPHLPNDVVALFIGRPGLESQDYVRRLRDRAVELGVADRLRITGYVEEEELDAYLAATDLALCPFREASASGSLATWIAAERPVVASDLPLFEEYNARVPGAIATFAPFAPEVLAAQVKQTLQRPESEVQPRLHALREALSLAHVMQQHAGVYRQVAGRSTRYQSE